MFSRVLEIYVLADNSAERGLKVNKHCIVATLLHFITDTPIFMFVYALLYFYHPSLLISFQDHIFYVFNLFKIIFHCIIHPK